MQELKSLGGQECLRLLYRLPRWCPPGRGGRGVVVELVVVRAGVEGGCGGGVATVEIVVVVHLVRTMPVPPTTRPLGMVKLF